MERINVTNTEREEARNLNDLDSIEVGSPSKGGKIKLYINTREDEIQEIKQKIDLMIECARYATEQQA